MKNNDTIKILRYLSRYLQNLVREQKLNLRPLGYGKSLSKLQGLRSRQGEMHDNPRCPKTYMKIMETFLTNLERKREKLAKEPIRPLAEPRILVSEKDNIARKAKPKRPSQTKSTRTSPLTPPS